MGIMNQLVTGGGHIGWTKFNYTRVETGVVFFSGVYNQKQIELGWKQQTYGEYGDLKCRNYMKLLEMDWTQMKIWSQDNYMEQSETLERDQWSSPGTETGSKM